MILVIDAIHRDGERGHQHFAPAVVVVGLNPGGFSCAHGIGVPGLILVAVFLCREIGIGENAVFAEVVRGETQRVLHRGRVQRDGGAKDIITILDNVLEHLFKPVLGVFALFQNARQEQCGTLHAVQQVLQVDDNGADGVLGLRQQSFENFVTRQAIIHQHTGADD